MEYTKNQTIFICLSVLAAAALLTAMYPIVGDILYSGAISFDVIFAFCVFANGEIERRTMCGLIQFSCIVMAIMTVVKVVNYIKAISLI